jgi:hypothetical protein
VHLRTAAEHETIGVAGNPLRFKSRSLRAPDGSRRLSGCRIALGTGEGVPGGGLRKYVERHWGRQKGHLLC